MKFGHFEVGQRIRAYDHEPLAGRPELYLEGVIVERLPEGTADCPYAHYIVDVDHDETFRRSPLPRQQVRVPFETTADYDCRVMLATRDDTPLAVVRREELINALWYFIENATPDAHWRTEAFFILRERVSEHVAASARLTKEDEPLIREWLNCTTAEVDDDGDAWVAGPMTGHWLSDDAQAEYRAWRASQR